jgi:hypothetical protein
VTTVLLAASLPQSGAKIAVLVFLALVIVIAPIQMIRPDLVFRALVRINRWQLRGRPAPEPTRQNLLFVRLGAVGAFCLAILVLVIRD